VDCFTRQHEDFSSPNCFRDFLFSICQPLFSQLKTIRSNISTVDIVLI
jgi:hypothetical protein